MKTLIALTQVFTFRARRQYLAPEARGHTPEDVFDILRALQPFQPTAGSIPGSAPHPRSRVVGYEDEWSQRWRLRNRLIKGRFMHGNVAYIARQDLALYAAAFRSPMRDPMPLPARRILGYLERHGPMPKSALRELTGLERGRFIRALTALNQAFEVMEIQREVDWDSPWDLYRRSFSGADFYVWKRIDAQTEVLLRFIKAFGVATVAEMVDWSGWPQRTIQMLLDGLRQVGAVVGVQIEGQVEPAYLASDDVEALEAVAPITAFCAILPPNDPFVLPQWSRVKAHYQFERLPYCLGVVVEDGEIVGAAWGHYKRRYAHIEEFNLEPDLVHSPPNMDQILAALEAHVSGGNVPVHIYGINGPIDAPWMDEILTRNGYVWKTGYYVKEWNA